MLDSAAGAVCTILNIVKRYSAPSQAPASGRLAAAMATNCAIRRLMRDGVERSNERTRSIEISFHAGGWSRP